MLSPLIQLAVNAVSTAFKLGEAAGRAQTVVPPPRLSINPEKVELLERLLEDLEAHGRLYWLFHPRAYHDLKLMAARARSLSWSEPRGLGIKVLEHYKERARAAVVALPFLGKGDRP